MEAMTLCEEAFSMRHTKIPIPSLLFYFEAQKPRLKITKVIGFNRRIRILCRVCLLCETTSTPSIAARYLLQNQETPLLDMPRENASSNALRRMDL